MTTAAVFDFSAGKPYKSEHDGLTIWWYESLDSLHSLDPVGVDVIVCPFLYSVYGKRTGGEIDTNHLDQLVQVLLRASELGVACCLLVGGQDAPLREHVPTCLGERLLTEEGVRIRVMPHAGLTVKPEFLGMGADVFEDYLRASNVLAHVVFELPDDRVPVPYLILAHGAGANQDVWGFALRKGEGLIYVLPGQPTLVNRTDLLPLLIHSLLRFKSLSRPESPFITESFQFTRERDVRAKRETLAEEASELDEELAEYDRRKDILFLRDDDLADRVPGWLTQYLGVATRRVEEYKEDFWLVDAEGGDAAICETKALTQNVKRQHIRALALHRDGRDLPDDYPSLLVVNTFADAETEEEKARQRVAPLECSNAVKEHVLVVRALDLVRLLDQAEQGVVTRQEVWELLTTATGWLKVEGDGREVIKA